MRNNEPAFPLHIPQGNFVESETVTGMTIRDYFAAKAMAPMLAGATLPTKADRDEWLPLLAEVAYEVADAMMKAREAA